MSSSALHLDWAASLRAAREKAKLSRERLAELMEVDPSAVRHWERGAGKPRDLDRYAAICKTTVQKLWPKKAAG